MEFKTEQEMLAYRRLCETIAKHPEVWAGFIEDLGVEFEGRAATSTHGVKFFKMALIKVSRIGLRLAKREFNYWVTGG